METIRFWFSKTGRAKYISHLDLMRAMTRTLRRAGFPLWYTEGFHPHLYLTFGQPLSLGFESDCEAMEVKALAPIDFEAAKERLNALLPPDIRVHRVAKAEPPLSDIAYSEYRVELRFSADPATPEQYAAFSALEEVQVEKKTKRGIAKINLAPALTMTRAESDGNALVLHMILPCGQTSNINPTLVTGAFLDFLSREADVHVRRTAVLTEQLAPFA